MQWRGGNAGFATGWMGLATDLVRMSTVDLKIPGSYEETWLSFMTWAASNLMQPFSLYVALC